MGTFHKKFIESVEATPEKTAIVSNEENVSYMSLHQMLEALPYDFEKNSHVATQLNSTLELVLLMLAASRDSFTLVPLPKDLPLGDNLINRLDLNCVITAQGLKQIFPTSQRRKNGDAYIIVSTSGSTSDPKPIVLTEEIKLRRIQAAVDAFKLTNSDVILVSTPIHHSLAQRGVLLGLTLGATIVITENFSPEKYLDALEENNVTFTFSVSTQLERAACLLGSREFPSLRHIVSTSSTIREEVKKKLLARVNIHECYGTSEIGCVTGLLPEDMKERGDSVGKALPGVKIKIDNPDANGTGEILAKSPWRFKEYYNLSKETNDAFDSCGFFKTGDLGYTRDGYLYYSGRSKEMIKTGGISVYPIDIERALKKVKGVEDVAVIGVPDEYFGEAVVAIVQGAPPLQSLMEAGKRELASYQRPLKYEFVDKLPRNKLGKLQKFKLVEKYKNLNLGKRLGGMR